MIGMSYNSHVVKVDATRTRSRSNLALARYFNIILYSRGKAGPQRLATCSHAKLRRTEESLRRIKFEEPSWRSSNCIALAANAVLSYVQSPESRGCVRDLMVESLPELRASVLITSHHEFIAAAAISS